MKIERIDDNSIRCTLTSLDLSSRNINLRDMTYGSAAAKRLFSEMMQKAQAEVGFTPDNTPLMIEAVPLQGGSIQLIISKVEDPEELDTRFSKFSQDAFSQNGWISQLASEILEGAQGIIKQNKEAKQDSTGEKPSEQQLADKSSVVRIYRFASLDRVISAASAIANVYSGGSSLYKDPGSTRYYLVLHAAFGDLQSLSRASNILSEYGTKINGEALNEAYYKEHFDALVAENAIGKLSRI